jgi:hypothetical protein
MTRGSLHLILICWCARASASCGGRSAGDSGSIPVGGLEPPPDSYAGANNSSGPGVGGSATMVGSSSEIGAGGSAAAGSSGGTSPVSACTSHRFLQVTTGDYHACGLLDDGCARCWGSNTDDLEHAYLGQASPPPLAFLQLAAGYGFTCGLTVDQRIICWGNPPSLPAGPYVALSASASGVCGLTAEGSANCADYFGPETQLGPFTSIAAGEGMFCGLLKTGALRCFGGNQPNAPPKGQFSAVSVDSYSMCAIDEQGTGSCWGGFPFTTDEPVQLLDAGDRHLCAITLDGRARCWGGDNDAGQSNAPSGTFVAISAGGIESETDSGFSCGVRDDGTITCWGHNEHGESTPPAP